MKPFIQLFSQIAIVFLAIFLFSVKAFDQNLSSISTSFSCLFNPIYFDKDKAEIKPEYYPELYYLSRYMKENPHYYVKLIVHTDSRNTEEFNIELSEKRCKAVIAFMNAAYRLDSSNFVMELVGDKDPMIKGAPDEPNERVSNLLTELHNRIEFECYYK